MYFKDIIEHKKKVFTECWKDGLYFHAFTHDLSKFSPLEFFAYADWFYGEYGVNCITYEDIFKKCCKYELKNRFDRARKRHCKNKHHWNYWIGKDMPEKYMRRMICDWKAISKEEGYTVREFYIKNYDKINLTGNSRALLELKLGLKVKRLNMTIVEIT